MAISKEFSKKYEVCEGCTITGRCVVQERTSKFPEDLYIFVEGCICRTCIIKMVCTESCDNYRQYRNKMIRREELIIWLADINR